MSRLLQLVGPVVLLSISIPLAFFAVITTAFAMTVLMIRVTMVYFELVAALFSSFIFPDPPVTHTQSAGAYISPPEPHALLISNLPKGKRRLPAKSGSFASLLGTNGLNRDFEGLGGWRISPEDNEDAIWIGQNARLELPTAGVGLGGRRRHHHRSLSAQSHMMARNSKNLKMSAASSEGRTSPTSHGYFDVVGTGGTSMSPEESKARDRMERRRLSVGSASVSPSSRKGSFSSLKHYEFT